MSEYRNNICSILNKDTYLQLVNLTRIEPCLRSGLSFFNVSSYCWSGLAWGAVYSTTRKNEAYRSSIATYFTMEAVLGTSLFQTLFYPEVVFTETSTLTHIRCYTLKLSQTPRKRFVTRRCHCRHALWRGTPTTSATISCTGKRETTLSRNQPFVTGDNPWCVGNEDENHTRQQVVLVRVQAHEFSENPRQFWNVMRLRCYILVFLYTTTWLDWGK